MIRKYVANAHSMQTLQTFPRCWGYNNKHTGQLASPDQGFGIGQESAFF